MVKSVRRWQDVVVAVRRWRDQGKGGEAMSGSGGGAEMWRMWLKAMAGCSKGGQAMGDVAEAVRRWWDVVECLWRYGGMWWFGIDYTIAIAMMLNQKGCYAGSDKFRHLM